MIVPEILAQFERNNGRFPRRAVEEAGVRQEEMTPDLLEVLEKVAQVPEAFAKDNRMSLLASSGDRARIPCW